MKILFPEFKTKTVTFSYDDGTVEDKWLTDKFRQYGVKGTFNLNSGLYYDIYDFVHQGIPNHLVRLAPEWADAVYEGFEVAAHGLRHLIISGAKEDDRLFDVVSDMDNHEKKYGKRPTGYAYPCGKYDDDAIEFLKKLGIKYARTTKSTGTFEIPENFYMWHPTCHDKDGLKLAEEFVNSSFDEMKLLYIWGHSFEFQKQDFNRYENMENILKTISGKDDIWYATNGEIEEYITASKNIKKVDGKYINPSEIKIYIEDEGKQVIV